MGPIPTEKAVIFRRKDVDEWPGGFRMDDDEGCDLRQDYLGFWYQKIARATKATVMIQRTMSLARFFSLSSTISAVQHT